MMVAEDATIMAEALEVLAVEVLLQEEKVTLLQEEKADSVATETQLQEREDSEAKEEVLQEEKVVQQKEPQDVLKVLAIAQDQEDQEETNIPLLIFL
jgi:hypothetical protein